MNISSVPPIANSRSNTGDERARLREAAHALEGVFLQQLFKAMRATGQENSLTSGSPAEEMFTAMLDGELAQRAAQQSTAGLGEALYRQLSRHLSEGI